MRDLKIAFALLAAMPVLSAPAAHALTVAPSPALQATCHQIAEQVMKADPAMYDRAAEAAVTAMFAQSPPLVEMDRSYPGLRAVIFDVSRREMARAAAEVHPLAVADYERFYLARLNESEARTYLAFLTDADTQVFLGQMRSNFSFKEEAKTLVKGQNTSTQDILKDRATMAQQAADSLSLRQKAKIAGFIYSPLGRKVTGFNPEKLEIDRKWTNYTTPAGEKRAEQAVIEAMLGHIAKSDPAKAEQIRRAIRADKIEGKS